MKHFCKSVVFREHKPSWERLWDDFIQEETCDEALKRQQSKGGEIEENVALTVKSKKNNKKKDLSKSGAFSAINSATMLQIVPRRRGRWRKIQHLTTLEEYVAKFEGLEQ